MRSFLIGLSVLFMPVLMLTPGAAPAQQLSSTKPPETFQARAEARAQAAGASAQVTIRIEKYTTDRDRMAMLEALKGGFQTLLPVLRKAPEVGYIELNGRRAVARWARMETKGTGRTITVVADSPLAFIGGGAVDAKPREGFDVAVVQLDVDVIGLGTGSMAPAARVSPGGATGVQIDDYAGSLVKLLTVQKLSNANANR